jgi:N-acetylglucosamine kinase-like BadF-type ATPase
MNLFSRMSDGRAAPGPLHALVRKRLGLEADLDLCARIYGESANARAAFAQFAKVVHEAAMAGDDQARAIFVQAARELVTTVLATRRSLAVPHTASLPVSYSGGVFAGSAALLAAFMEMLNTMDPPFECRAPLFPPVIGASLYAARLAGTPLTDEAQARLGSQCTAAGLPQ